MKRFCNTCKEELELVMFTKNSSYTSGYTYECKTCCNARAREYRKTEAYANWKEVNAENLE